MAHVIIGLGNPGGEYAKTRHNAGRMALERFADARGWQWKARKGAHALVAEGTLGGQKVTLVIPDAAMNLSGKAAPAFVKSRAAAKKLLVVRDELDLPLGTLKMTGYGRGSGGHKGAESIMRALKTKDFAQMKIGISAATAKGKLKKPEAGEKVIQHVIGKFSPKEEPLLNKTLEKAGEAIEAFVTAGIEAAFMKANTSASRT